MNAKYDMAARLTVNMVVEELMRRHSWGANETLSKMSKTSLYERLVDSGTGLWKDNPLDLADLFDRLFAGEQLTFADFFN
jgi:hypothetical protein